jgi:hypothetical protein
MDVIGAVTAGAAGVAALLAGINLYVSGRRELDKWTRETLVEALVVFLDSSFKQSGLCTSFISPNSPLEDGERLRTAVIATHDLQTDTLTRLRLLAPSRVVTAAESLHRADHGLIALCFMESVPQAETIDAHRMLIRRVRQQFVESARSTLRLKDTAEIGHTNIDTRWYKFRSVINLPEEKSPREQDVGRELQLARQVIN